VNRAPVEVRLDAVSLSRDPRTTYSALCDAGAVHRVELPDGLPVWLVTRHAEARTALTDPRLSKSPQYAAPELHGRLDSIFEYGALSRVMFNLDPPEHSRLRRLAAKAFTRDRIAHLRIRVQRICDDLLDVVEPRGSADLMESYAQPLPALVIAELLGIPPSDRARFDVLLHFPRDLNMPVASAQIALGWSSLNQYFKDLVSARRAHPGEDLISAMLAARDGHDRLTDAEVRTMAFLLLIAGYETTVNLIGNGAFELLTRPERLAELRTAPELPPPVVEEVLRFNSPVKLIVYRFAKQDLAVGERLIRAGDCVLVAVDAANHDPRRFTDPARLDIDRDATGHLSFGHGRHHCLGAPLARLEAQIALGTLLRRLDGLTLAIPPERVGWHPSILVRRLAGLPVTFVARST